MIPFAILLSIGYFVFSFGMEHHQRLIKDLLDEDKYDMRARPVRDYRHPVVITLRFNLYQIIDVNEPNQYIEFYIWFVQYWDDEFLIWDPAAYGGITTITLPWQKVWIPDTYLYNNLQMVRESSERYINAMVIHKNDSDTPHSQVRFFYPAIFRYTCKMNIFYFPFDVQNCTMTFGSWTADASTLNYTCEPKVMMEKYVENEEWRLIKAVVRRTEVAYDCCPYPYTEINLDIIIQRKPLYYLANLVIPTAIITLIAVVGFFMPANTSGERTEKVNLGITTLLAMSILLLMVSDDMPTTSSFIPIISWYFLSIIVLISLGTLLTSIIIVIQMQGANGDRVPSRVRVVFFHTIARALCVREPRELRLLMEKLERIETAENRIRSAKEMSNCNNANGTQDDDTLLPLGRRHSKTFLRIKFDDDPFISARNQSRPSSPESPKNADFVVRSYLEDIKDKLERVLHVDSAKQDIVLANLEWEYLAQILDRIMLLIFCTLIVTVTLMVFALGLVPAEVVY